MQLPLPRNALPASVPLGERRSIQALAGSLPLKLGSAPARDFLSHQPAPYPSPPMSGSPPDRLNASHPVKDSSQNSHHLFNSTASLTPPLRLPEPAVPSSAAAGGRSGPSTHMAVSSPVRRSPFVASTSILSQSQRRAKSHVASACVNCRKAHLACDVRRPCPRCVGLNKQDSCKDVQHKKRGRPRLREERTHSFEVNQLEGVHSASANSSPISPRATILPSHQAHIHRVVKSQIQHEAHLSTRQSADALGNSQDVQIEGLYDDRPSSSNFVRRNLEITTYLTTDLIFVEPTGRVKEFLGYQDYDFYEVKDLFEITSPTDRHKLYHISKIIVDEIQMKDPTYRSPALEELYAAIHNVAPTEVLSAIQKHENLADTLQLRFANGQYIPCRVQVYLVKASVFFVVAEIFLLEAAPPPFREQYGGSLVCSHPPQLMPPLPSPPFLGASRSRPFVGESSGLISPYSLQPSRAFQPPHDSRPRSLQVDPQQYPSLAPYANSSLSTAVSSLHSSGRSRLFQNSSYADSTFTHASDQIDILSDLRLPPLRDMKAVKEPAPTEPPNLNSAKGSGTEIPPKRERIAVQEMLQ